MHADRTSDLTRFEYRPFLFPARFSMHVKSRVRGPSPQGDNEAAHEASPNRRLGVDSSADSDLEIAARLRARGYYVDIDSEVELFLIVSGEGLEKRPISRLGAVLLSEGLVTLRQLAGSVGGPAELSGR